MANDIDINLGDSVQQVQDLTKALKDLKANFTSNTEEARKISDETKKAGKSLSEFKSNIKQAGGSALEMSKNLQSSTEAVTGMVKQLGQIIPVIGPAVAAAVNFFYQIDKQSRTAKFSLSQLNIAFGQVGRSIQAQQGNFIQLLSASDQLGQSFDETLGQAMQMSQFMNQRDIMAQGAKGLRDFAKVAAGTGVSQDMLGRITEQSYRKMGLSVDDAYKSVAQFHTLAGKFGININKIADDVYNAASGMELLGIKGRDITPVYETFMKVLGKGREHLAGDLTRSFVQGLGKMNEGFKAFFGTMGGLGGGDTLASMFNFETLFETGKISKLGSLIGNSLVETTGAGLMTKQEAINTGQTQQFYMQRKMIEQSFGVGFKEAEKISEVLMQAQTGQITDVQAQQTIDDLKKTGQDQLSGRLNALDHTVNQMLIRVQSTAPKFLQSMDKVSKAFSSGMDKGGFAGGLKEAWKTAVGESSGVFDVIFQKLYDIGDAFIANLKKSFPMLSMMSSDKKVAPSVSSAAAYRQMSTGDRQKLIDTSTQQVNMRKYGEPGFDEWQEIRSRALYANVGTKKDDGSPGFMYSLPQLNFGQALTAVKTDEQVLTSQQASRVQQTVGAAQQSMASPSRVQVETVCRECLNRVVADGVHTIIRQSQYSEN